jgi:hypothetical protein
VDEWVNKKEEIFSQQKKRSTPSSAERNRTSKPTLSAVITSAFSLRLEHVRHPLNHSAGWEHE